MVTKNVSFEEIHDLAKGYLLRNGCDEANAGSLAKVIARAEADGCHSHGLMRISGYIAALNSGKVNGSAEPRIEHVLPSVLRVDGDGGFAPLANDLARPHLIKAAKAHGIAVMALVNVHHFNALWSEVEPIAQAGLCAFACTSYKPAVIPAGGKKALYGTNPMAFGWPRKGDVPVVFDQASSMLARGEVMLAAREGHSLRDGVGVDSEGEPSNDPNEVLKGALLAFGGYKGSSIAMMVELLSGPLIGECLSFEAAQRDNNDGGPPQGGEFILAIDTAAFGDVDQVDAHGRKLFDKIEEQESARLPGSKRWKNRENSIANGIDVPKSLLDQLEGL